MYAQEFPCIVVLDDEDEDELTALQNRVVAVVDSLNSHAAAAEAFIEIKEALEEAPRDRASHLLVYLNFLRKYGG